MEEKGRILCLFFNRVDPGAEWKGLGMKTLKFEEVGPIR